MIAQQPVITEFIGQHTKQLTPEGICQGVNGFPPAQVFL